MPARALPPTSPPLFLLFLFRFSHLPPTTLPPLAVQFWILDEPRPDAINGYQHVLRPGKMVPDVCYHLNQQLDAEQGPYVCMCACAHVYFGARACVLRCMYAYMSLLRVLQEYLGARAGWLRPWV